MITLNIWVWGEGKNVSYSVSEYSMVVFDEGHI